MNMHGGDVELKSTEGKGSIFTIWMPIVAHGGKETKINEESIDDLFAFPEV